MSSSTDDHLDNSTTALLEQDAGGENNARPGGDQQQSLSATDSTSSPAQQQESQSEKDTTASTPQQNGETSENLSTAPNAEPESSSIDELKITNENQANSDNTKPSTDPASNPTEDQIEPDNSSPSVVNGDKSLITPAKKPSRSSRIRNTLNSLPPEKVRKARMATSIEDITSLRLWKGIVAEFLGTLLLTLVGCGSCINLQGITNTTNPVVQIALCFGLSVATIVWAIGHVSGGHINPAVTAAMLATRKISLAKGVFFVIFQLIGAVVGAGLLYAMTPSDYHGNLGATLVSKHLNVGQAVGVEIFITFVLVFVVFASVDSKRRDLNGSTPLTIGLSVTMCHLFAVDFTGSSMNTARSFGPALVMGKWSDHWVYWVGPILGGVVAGLLYENIFAVNASLAKAKACLLSSDYDDEKYQAQKMKIRILEEDPDEPKDDLPLNEKNEQADGDPSNA